MKKCLPIIYVTILYTIWYSKKLHKIKSNIYTNKYTDILNENL